MPDIVLKSVQEIKAKLRDLLHRAGNRFIQERLKACPENCAGATRMGAKVQPCARCKANPGEPCRVTTMFQPRYTVDELKLMFQDLLKKREWILRQHRDIAMLLWVLGNLDPSEEPDPSPLPPHLMHDPGKDEPWIRLEGDTLRVSPNMVPILSQFFSNLPALLDRHNDASMEGRTLGIKPGSPS